MIRPKADFLIESAYEVANPIGGIYTVLVSKSKEMRRYYGENFYSIGPYYKRYTKVEFEEKAPPEGMAVIFKELEKEDIICH